MIERLIQLVGPEAVRTGDHAARWAVHGVVPHAVVAPASAEEAAAVLARASEEGWAVEPAGAGTCLDHGRPPARLDVVLTTRQLADCDACAPADLTATVGAGVRLGTLADRLAQHGQWLPLDPPGDREVTLGGAVSMAAAGPLRLGHGTPRDHVLGLQLVTGDGRILELGGGVVKNVAGYDLTKLVIGSRGTLGLVTRVNVRLRSVPARDVTVPLTAPELEVLLDVAESVRELRLEAAALEVASPRLAQQLLGNGREAWLLLARFQGTAEATDDAEKQIARLAKTAGAEYRGSVPDGRALWAKLSAREAAAALVVRLADRPAALRATLALAREASAAVRPSPRAVGTANAGTRSAADAPPPWTGLAARDVPASAEHGVQPRDRPPVLLAHAGVGIVRWLVDAEDFGVARQERWAEALSAARAKLTARRGTLIVARAPAGLTARLDAYGDPGPALRLMRGLKAEFDPAGVLAGGRFVV